METIRLHDRPTPRGFLALVAVGLMVAFAGPALLAGDAGWGLRLGLTALGVVLGGGVLVMALWPALDGPRVELGPGRFTLHGRGGGSWAWPEFDGVRLVVVPRGGGTVVALSLREANPRARPRRTPRWLRRGLLLDDVAFSLSTLDVPPGVSLLDEIRTRIEAARDDASARPGRVDAASPPGQAG